MTLTDEDKDEVRRLLNGDAQFLHRLTPVEWREAAVEWVYQQYSISCDEAVILVDHEAAEMGAKKP